MARKKSLGRRKIPMMMISSKSARHVTFSKRRTSLFRKASELSILTGANVAVIVFSPGGRPYSFGHPSVDVITNRFRNFPSPLGHSYLTGSVSTLNQQFNILTQQVDAEKKRGERLREELKKQRFAFLKRPLDELNLSQLEEGKAAMEELWGKLAKCIQGMSLKGSDMPSSSAKPNLCSMGWPCILDVYLFRGYKPFHHNVEMVVSNQIKWEVNFLIQLKVVADDSTVFEEMPVGAPPIQILATSGPLGVVVTLVLV